MFPIKAETIVSVVVKLLDIVVDLIGLERTKALLTLDEVQRANAVADAIEWVRFTKVG